MGSGISSEQQHTLSSYEKQAIAKKLRVVYDNLKALNKFSDHELHLKLTEEYNRLAEDIQNSKQVQNGHATEEQKSVGPESKQDDPSFSSSNVAHTSTYPPSKDGIKESHPYPPKKKEEPAVAGGSHSPHHMLPTHNYTAKTKPSDPGDSVPEKKKANRSTRRRSFDVEQQVKRQQSFAVSKTTENGVSDLSVSKSTPVLASVSNEKEATAVDIDSWDSVTQQPFCETCKMAFKSIAFLDRHIKFSSLHQENVKRLSDGDTTVHSSPIPKHGISEAEMVAVTKQEEGIHYRLLYSGSKFYWRCQQTIDVDIYHHFLPHVIEIIPYHSGKQKELPRIYLDYELVLHQVNDSVKDEVNNRKQLLLSDRFTTAGEIDDQKLQQEVTLIKIVTFILSRITFDPKITMIQKSLSSIDKSLSSSSKENKPVTVEGEGQGEREGEEEKAKEGKTASQQLKELNENIASTTANVITKDEDHCGFIALFGDDHKLFPVLQAPPIILVPMNVNRRRRTTAEEFDSEVTTIHNDQSFINDSLNRANEFTKVNARAEKIAQFVYTAAKLIKEKQYGFRKETNKYRRLWLWAIHRILYQNKVTKNRNHLNERNLNYIPQSPYKPVRVRERHSFDAEMSHGDSSSYVVHSAPAAIVEEDPMVNSINSLVQQEG
jgi:hypothetical protein